MALGATMDPPPSDPPSDLPYFHYITEPDRINFHSAVQRTTFLTSLPERCPYRVRPSLKNGKKLEFGWLEFHSSEYPDPKVARPGDVWIQAPCDFDPTTGTPDVSACRLFVCYSAEGHQWTEWEGDERIHANNPPVGMHPLVSPASFGGTTKRHAQFYLAFTGNEFTWVNGTRLAIMSSQWRLGKLPGVWMERLAAKHKVGSIPFLGAAEVVAAWLERKQLIALGLRKRRGKKRVANGVASESPSVKRLRLIMPSHTGSESVPSPLADQPHFPPSVAMQPFFPVPSSSSSEASDDPADELNAPSAPTFLLRPASFARPPTPVEARPVEVRLPSPAPPPPPPPVPVVEGGPPLAPHPRVTFTPTLSPRHSERGRKPIVRSSVLPMFTAPARPTSATASISISSPASAPTSAALTMPSPASSSSAPLPSSSVPMPFHVQGRRAPPGAIDAPPAVRGRYAKAGATQRGWSLYIGERELLMTTRCDKCLQAGAVCSGIEGERCGRCRSIRRPCSHSLPARSKVKTEPVDRAVEKSPVTPGTGELPRGEVTRKRQLTLRLSGKPKSRDVLGSANHSSASTREANAQDAAVAATSSKSGTGTGGSPPDSLQEDDDAVEELMDLDGLGENENAGANPASRPNVQEKLPIPPANVPNPPARERTSPVQNTVFTDVLIPPEGYTQPQPRPELPDKPSSSQPSALEVSATMVAVDTHPSPILPTEETTHEDHASSVPDAPAASAVPLEPSVESPVPPIQMENEPSAAEGMDVDPPQAADPQRPQDRANAEGSLDSPRVVASSPAPNCSQEVRTHATDGAGEGGGLSSPRLVVGTSMFTPAGTRIDSLGDVAALPTPRESPAIEDVPFPPAAEVPSPHAENRVSEEEELARFMELALSGMAQVQEGLRGVFAIQKRKRASQKRKVVIAVAEREGHTRG
ncbi:hypothetical protein BC834DRAFT_630359 [Gloeopeniophorella convolvens]|nr:hypothetical protein BC834DRAFT_630359 [Gloeopeniophorella convolvens]